MKAVVVAVLVVAAAASVHALIPRAIPLYKQCDQQWANDQMGTTASCNACGEQPATVCEQGCAMSCVTMALAGNGVTVPQVLPPARTRGTHAGHRQRQNRVTPTPGTMNAWLHATGGYWCAWGDCNNLMLTAPERLSTSAYNVSFVSENEKPELAVLQMWILTDGFIPIGHVRNKTHFVLLTGWDDADPNTLYVNDPGFPQTSYAYADVADVLLYTVLPPTALPVTKAQAFAAAAAAPRAFQSAGPTTGWLSRAKLWRADADTDADSDATSADAPAEW